MKHFQVSEISAGSREVHLEERASPFRKMVARRFPFVIGSGKNCDLCISDSHVSNPHACIVQRDGRFFLFDLGSRNKTFVIAERSTGNAPSPMRVTEIRTPDIVAEEEWKTAREIEDGMQVAFAMSLWVVRRIGESIPEEGTGRDRDSVGESGSTTEKKGKVATAVIEILSGGEVGRIYRFDVLPVVIGRSRSKSLLAFEGQTSVSGTHACIGTDSRGRLVLEDLNSRNGSFVNGRQVSGQVVVKPGDVVSLAKAVSFRVHLEGAADRFAGVKRCVYGGGLVVIALSVVLQIWRGRSGDDTAVVPEDGKTNGVVTVAHDVPGAMTWEEILASKPMLISAPEAHAIFKAIPADTVNSCMDRITNDLSLVIGLLDDLPRQQPSVEAVTSWCGRMDAVSRSYAGSVYAEAFDRCVAVLSSDALMRFVLDRFASDAAIEAIEVLDAVPRCVRDQAPWHDLITGVKALRLKAERLEVAALNAPLSELQDIVIEIEKMLQETERSSSERTLQAYWTSSRQRIVHALRETSAVKECPKERMLVLRRIQSIAPIDPNVGQDIVAIEKPLAPELKSMLQHAAKETPTGRRAIYREILELCAPSDWTSQYHAIAKAHVE